MRALRVVHSQSEPKTGGEMYLLGYEDGCRAGKRDNDHTSLIGGILIGIGLLALLLVLVRS